MNTPHLIQGTIKQLNSIDTKAGGKFYELIITVDKYGSKGFVNDVPMSVGKFAVDSVKDEARPGRRIVATFIKGSREYNGKLYATDQIQSVMIYDIPDKNGNIQPEAAPVETENEDTPPF